MTKIYRSKTPKNKWTLRSTILFYRRMLKAGIIKPDGTGYRRMKDLEEEYFKLDQ